MKRSPMVLMEIHRDTFGGNDGRAINRHSERMYINQNGELFQLDRTLDAYPKFFTLVGPFRVHYVGVLHAFPIELGKSTWGEGMSWPNAIKTMCHALHATVIHPVAFLRKYGKKLDTSGNPQIEAYCFQKIEFTVGLDSRQTEYFVCGEYKSAGREHRYHTNCPLLTEKAA